MSHLPPPPGVTLGPAGVPAATDRRGQVGPVTGEPTLEEIMSDPIFDHMRRADGLAWPEVEAAVERGQQHLRTTGATTMDAAETPATRAALLARSDQQVKQAAQALGQALARSADSATLLDLVDELARLGEQHLDLECRLSLAGDPAEAAAFHAPMRRVVRQLRGIVTEAETGATPVPAPRIRRLLEEWMFEAMARNDHRGG